MAIISKGGKINRLTTNNQTFFKATVYTVAFQDWNSATLKIELVDPGSDAVPPVDPSRANYTFDGWSGTYTNVTSNRTITATYAAYPVITWKNWDGTVLKTESVAPGGNGTPPADPTKTDWFFDGWSGTYTNVTVDVIITALFYEQRQPETLNNTFVTSDGVYVPGDTFTFSKAYRTNVNFQTLNGVNFRIKLYGASGGYHNSSGGRGGNSNGGIIDATMNLSAYPNLYIDTAAPGYDADGIDGSTGVVHSGGAPYGGDGAGTGGSGGGGRTTLKSSTSSLSELLVAGGGGGGKSTMGTNGIRRSGSDGQTGMEGDYARDNAGGGGGYYGGQASTGDDTRDSGSGSNYNNTGLTTILHQNTRIVGVTGGNQGYGYFVIEVISID